jgi:hypothetical protein
VTRLVSFERRKSRCESLTLAPVLDVEILTKRRFDANLDVVEVDEHGDVETVLIGQWNFLSSFYSMPTAAISAPPGHPVRCIENLSHLRSDRKFNAQRARMSIVRDLKFAERLTRSGRDLEDQDVAEFESIKLQS